jgi:hypothetical protein
MLLQETGVDLHDSPKYMVIRKQFLHTDIVVEIGTEAILVIEDKTHTGESRNQLIDYRNAILQHYAGRHCAFAYLRTGEQSSLEGVVQAGWKPIGREAILQVLRHTQGINDVLDEFTRHLEGIDHDVGSFRKLLPVGWQVVRPPVRQRLIWAGLFQQLGPILHGNWDYVPNQLGGFMGFWWSFLPVQGGSIYFQLEHDRLLVKVDAGTGDKRKLRDEWLPRVIHHHGPIKFKKPDRLGHGRWMTVGIAEQAYLQTKADGTLDLAETIILLQTATTMLVQLVSQGGWLKTP